MMLTIKDELPEGFLEVTAKELHRLLPGPTLIHLRGRREPPLFVSTLLHGNEVTGLEALQQVLSRYGNRNTLPRALSIFIGNPEAAREGKRFLPGQKDYNRIWSHVQGPEAELAAQVQHIMLQRGIFATIDIHNNTGRNPHYACVNRLDSAFLHLASLFSRTVVYFLRPAEVLSRAFARMAPAVTIECGQPGLPAGREHAASFVDAALHLSQLPQHAVPSHDIDLFHTVAVVKLRPKTTFAFGDGAADLRFIPEIDRLNFRELSPGTLLGWLRDGDVRLDVRNEADEDVGHEYFDYADNELRCRQRVMPSMLTADPDIVRQDCLCYLMERLPPPAASRPSASGTRSAQDAHVAPGR